MAIRGSKFGRFLVPGAPVLVHPHEYFETAVYYGSPERVFGPPGAPVFVQPLERCKLAGFSSVIHRVLVPRAPMFT